MSKVVKQAQQSLANWQAAMANPATASKYSAGIDRVTSSPMEAAASPQAQALYLQNVQQAVSSGRMAAKLRASDFGQWKTQSKNLGATGLARGAQKGQSKVQAHFQKWTPIYQQASDAAHALPKGGLANATARFTAAISVLMQAAGRS